MKSPIAIIAVFLAVGAAVATWLAMSKRDQPTPDPAALLCAQTLPDPASSAERTSITGSNVTITYGSPPRRWTCSFELDVSGGFALRPFTFDGEENCRKQIASADAQIAFGQLDLGESAMLKTKVDGCQKRIEEVRAWNEGRRSIVSRWLSQGLYPIKRDSTGLEATSKDL